MKQEAVDRILQSKSYVSDDICEAVESEEMDSMSENEVFDTWLKFNGIIGYDYQIRTAIELIYGVKI